MLGGECRQRLFEKSLNECDIMADRWKLPPDAERACPSSKRPSLRQANEGIKAIPARAGSERREPIDRIPFVDAELEEKPAVVPDLTQRIAKQLTATLEMGRVRQMRLLKRH